MQMMDKNLNMAFDMSLKTYDYSALINFLNSDNITEKQIAVLKLDEIESKEDAKLLVSNLVGQDGKIRETVAFKINELIKNGFQDYFLDNEIFNLLLQGVMDINGNVCRQVIDTMRILRENSQFTSYFCPLLIEQTNSVLKEAEKIDADAKRYVKSKRNFQLYWNLEAIYDLKEFMDKKQVIAILLRTGVFYDYTIREKTAKIIKDFDDLDLQELKEKLKNDENYYVKRYMCS